MVTAKIMRRARTLVVTWMIYDDDHYDDNEDVIIEGRMVYLPGEAEHHQLMIKIGLPALGHLIKKIILMIIVCYREMVMENIHGQYHMIRSIV